MSQDIVIFTIYIILETREQKTDKERKLVIIYFLLKYINNKT